jgi:hypothetical protein
MQERLFSELTVQGFGPGVKETLPVQLTLQASGLAVKVQ